MSLRQNFESLKRTLPVAKTLEAYAIARSALFQTESLIGPAIELIIQRKRPKTIFDDRELFVAARAAMTDLLKQDVANIAAGIYPVSVLKPGNPLKHILRMPTMLFDGLALASRRQQKKAHAFSKEARELLEGLPEYYQRNFHYQGDGYLSAKSADLYEHQVEILFAGAADAMRRLILPPMKKHFADHPDGAGLTFLEIAAGTGRATRFVRLAFPKAKIVAVDLSAPYLKKAQSELSEFNHHDFVEANASDLPFKNETFDAVYSVFLFHELPLREREAVIAECQRVLKDGGFHGLVDSLQTGDVHAFDRSLEEFPQNFHEPFYKNYVANPMQTLLEKAGVAVEGVTTGFFSKCVFGAKRAALARN